MTPTEKVPPFVFDAPTIRSELMHEEAQHFAQVWELLQSPQAYEQIHYVNGRRVKVSVSEHTDNN